MNLSNLSPAVGSTRNNKRLGRGTGSGRGGTSTRGHKGQKSRSGYSKKSGFEGGQMPLQRRVPKFGFKNINRVEYKGINLDALTSLNEKNSTSTMDVAYFVSAGLVSKNAKIKILGRGEVTTALEVHAHAFSKSAVEAIEKAGGKAVTL
ncbi:MULTISPECIES: 50S ribosomal protein L15 [Hymenobacter]|jgi:large subunit ribosomal protein L15|uniref:Large ribosomal subunit protein uL15 n=3 Tax=Hymenobacter TaxID=89966 RepID=A0A4Z0PZN1_9BACT|nr:MULTISPECIES: 50S ribosomal protein L15 [Hymenobacter]MCB2407085.1 50S ribosomal protein L15 [Hymenobacter lucidus]TGE21922.1 50S ribosomal protein L15 [Hymenobacter aquaticus]UOQ72492.1 50S ribosomal protein L15 [Hymenobacter cellulosilyticus]